MAVPRLSPEEYYFPKWALGLIAYRRSKYRRFVPWFSKPRETSRGFLDDLARFFCPWTVNEYPGATRLLLGVLGYEETVHRLDRVRKYRAGKERVPVARLRLLVAWLRARQAELGAILERAEAELAEREAQPQRGPGFMARKDWDGSGVIRTKAHWDKGQAERP